MKFARSFGMRLGFTVALAFALFTIPSSAGTRPQVDLSVDVTTTPVPFVPGGVVTVTMTVHNAGPETAGATLPNQKSIVVLEKQYDIVMQPPPFLLFEAAVGCSAYAEESEAIPGLPGGGITLLFSYYFDAIAPGDSRTCVYRVHLLSSTREDFPTDWLVVTPNDDDINPGNDRFDYTFIAPEAPSAAVPVPARSVVGSWMLGLGLSLAVVFRRRRVTD